MQADKFEEFYKDKDIFISPNRPYVLAEGAFDGFPTTTCAEAGLNGLCMIMCDPLNLNVIFENNYDCILLENDPTQFYETVLDLSKNPGRIYEIGDRGKQTLRNKLHAKDQLAYRLSVINNII